MHRQFKLLPYTKPEVFFLSTHIRISEVEYILYILLLALSASGNLCMTQRRHVVDYIFIRLLKQSQSLYLSSGRRRKTHLALKKIHLAGAMQGKGHISRARYGCICHVASLTHRYTTEVDCRLLQRAWHQLHRSYDSKNGPRLGDQVRHIQQAAGDVQRLQNDNWRLLQTKMIQYLNDLALSRKWNAPIRSRNYRVIDARAIRVQSDRVTPKYDNFKKLNNFDKYLFLNC